MSDAYHGSKYMEPPADYAAQRTIDELTEEIGELQENNERLQQLLDTRAGKLLQKGKTFVVVAVDEPYFAEVYDMIREHELRKDTWDECDEYAYSQAIQEWKSLQ